MVYLPAEDSLMLSAEIKKYLDNLTNKEKIKVLDMGSGSGFQALTCLKSGIKKKNILCADIDPESIALIKKIGLNAIRTDLFSNLKKKKFDLIIFNAPYLPEDKYDKGKDTTAGKRGYELILEFLHQSKDRFNEDGKIFLLFSSLSKPKIILDFSKKICLDSKKLSEQGVGFFEKLFVYEFQKIKNKTKKNV